MKKILIAFCTVFMYCTISASEVSVTYSPEIKSYRTDLYGSAVVGDRILTLRPDKGGYAIYVNEAQNLNPVTSVPVINKRKQTVKCLDDIYMPEKMITLNNRAYLLVSQIDRKKDENILFAQELSSEGIIIGDLKQLANIKIESKKNCGSFRIELSEDRQKLVVLANPSYEKKNKEAFFFYIFGAQLDIIKKMLVTLPYEDENFSYNKLLIKDNGNVFILGEHTFERKEKKKGQDASEYVVVCVDIKAEKTTDFKIQVPNRNITNIGIELSKDQKNIQCLGFYSDIDKKNRNVGEDTDGVFNLTIDTESNQIIAKDFYEFTVDFVNKLLGKSKKKAKKTDEDEGIANTFELVKICPLADGSFYAFFENQYNYTVCHTDSQGRTHCTTYYVFGDIIACKVDPAGKIDKVTFLEKSQTTSGGTGFSSFLTVQKDDNISLIYNDHIDNIGDMKEPTGVATKKIALYSADVLPDGSFKKQIIKKYEDDRRIFIPCEAIAIDKTTFVSPYVNMPKGGPCACFSFFLNPKIGFVKIQNK